MGGWFIKVSSSLPSLRDGTVFSKVSSRRVEYGVGFPLPSIASIQSLSLTNLWCWELKKVIVTRVGLDQFFLTPIMVGAFYTSQALLEGQGIEEAKHRLNNSWQPTLVKNWILFIPVQLANFSIIPPHLRLVLVNVVSLFWNAYLSYSNANLVADEAGIEDLVTVKG